MMDNGAFIPALSMNDCPLVAASNTTAPNASLWEPPFSNCSHLWVLPVQMLLNSIKGLVTHMDAACGSQCCLFKMHKSAFVANIRGCLGRNLIQVRDEQITLLSSRASRKSRPPPRQRSQNSTIFPCSYLWDVTNEEWSYPKKKGFNKRKTTVLRMAVRNHYRHGLLHSLNRQKHFFFFPHSKLQQRYTQNEQVTQKHSW